MTVIMPTDKARVVCYTPPETKKELERIATDQHRSLSNLVELILMEYVTNQKNKESDRNG